MINKEETLRIGSRGSRLALVQATKVKSLLQTQQPNLKVEIIVIKTEGDIDSTSPIHEIGGKGVFVKYIERALSADEIDLAVHSLKDITSKPIYGLELVGFLAPESVTDALIAKEPYKTLGDLPAGSIIATGSLRRQAILKKMYPQLKTMDIRGNVNTRLDKLQGNNFHALLLSEAGLQRLGCQDQITQHFTPKQFCPAPGQGVITIQLRQNNDKLKSYVQAISCPKQTVKSQIELAFLEVLEFNCHAPLGVHVEIDKTKAHMQVFLANKNMDCFLENMYHWSLSDALEGARETAVEVIHWLANNES